MFDPLDAAETFLAGGGTMGALIRVHDWAATPLGSLETWPQSLRSTLSACLNSPILGAVLWGPDLRMLYNDAYMPSMADRHPSALGRPVAEVWGEAWEKVSPPFYHALKTGEGFSQNNVELRIMRHGEPAITFWNFSATPIRGEDGHIAGLLNQGVEITEQVKAERKLLALNASLSEQVGLRTQERDRLWRHTQDIQVVINGDGVFQAVNPAFTVILGWSAGEVIGRNVFEFLHDDWKSTQLALEHAREHVLPVFENRYRHKGGGFRWISWVATPEGDLIYASGRHITAEKAQSVELFLYKNIVQSNASPICAFDTEYRLIAFNKAHNDEFFRVNGFYTEIGDIFPDLFVPEQRPVMRALMARALTGETFSVVEKFGKPELGKPHWDISYTALRDETGTIIGAFHFAQDISPRLLAQAELQETQEALRQSQKMEAVGQLTGGLAHDFNNLLAIIGGSLELLQRRVLQGRVDDIERFVGAAQSAATRATALTHRLLAFSRRQTLNPKPTEINALIAGMNELVRRTMGPAITVETVDAGSLWTTLVDPHQLENALLNLCINARDAMPDGGRLTIETANHWLDLKAAKERELPKGQYVSLSVTDTGTGMPADVIAKAFDPFFTTKPLGQGTGLGLSMIYGFARQSGGQVHISSEVGQGASVCIYLPRYYGLDIGEVEPTEPTPQRARDGETVLVVDDEPGVRMLVIEVLEDLGYHAIEAEDGPAALRIMQSEVRIDLLVTDVGLPGGMNGRQVADAGRVARPGLKVLFITGYAEKAAIGDGHLDPGMSVMIKPFAVDMLANRIKELIADWRSLSRS